MTATPTSVDTLDHYGTVTIDVIPRQPTWPTAVIRFGHSDECGDYSIRLTPEQAVAIAHRLLQQADAATSSTPEEA